MPEVTGVNLLALDPSFRNTGWAVISLGKATELVVQVGVIRTKKADKKLKAFAGDDNHRCAKEIATALDTLLEEWMPDLVLAEAQSGSKNSRAAQLMGMGWGVISAVTCIRDVTVLQVPPTLVKEANTGSKKASKKEIEAAVKRRYSGAEKLMEAANINPGDREHVWDAISVAIACFDSNEVRTLRRIAERN
jgi:Holliday junction resolvasome RuvABC endonuclease subunit